MKKTQEDIINELKVNGWNEYIAPRVESITSFLNGDAYQKGIRPWLLSCKVNLHKNLANPKNEHETDMALKGELAALEMILMLPEMIEKYIASLKEAKKPSGSAGY